MNLGDRPKTEVRQSKRISLRVNGKSPIVTEDVDLDSNRNFELYFNGIEVHSSKEGNRYHVWIQDDNMYGYGDGLFDEWGESYAELMEKAMQAIEAYKDGLLASYEKSVDGLQKASDAVAKSFLAGGTTVTDDERRRMKEEKERQGISLTSLEYVFEQSLS